MSPVVDIAFFIKFIDLANFFIDDFHEFGCVILGVRFQSLLGMGDELVDLALDMGDKLESELILKIKHININIKVISKDALRNLFTLSFGSSSCTT